MFYCVPAIEPRARLETASERDSLREVSLPQGCDWAKDRANESAPSSERNATRNARTTSHCRGSRSGASRTRTGDLLGAIQGARRLMRQFCRDFGAQPGELTCRNSSAICGTSREFWHVAASAWQNSERQVRPSLAVHRCRRRPWQSPAGRCSIGGGALTSPLCRRSPRAGRGRARLASAVFGSRGFSRWRG
jgi:hypothetical protein